MKIGRSNVFGMLVDASEVEHRDCEAFQIVCPECREYLFKGLRANGASAIHYFSHYRTDPEANSLCEKRVAARASSGIHSDDSEERLQTLQHYLDSFSSMAMSLPMFEDPALFDAAKARLETCKSVRDMRSTLRKGLTVMPGLGEFIGEVAYGDPSDPEDSVFGRWDAGQAHGWVPRTGFARSIQVRVASDMLRTLLTKPAIPAWNTLYAAAWSMEIACAAAHGGEDAFAEYRNYVIPVMVEATMGRDVAREFQMLARMRCGAPYMKGPGTWLDKLQIEVLNNIVEILLSIDYSRWSRARAAGQEPMEISAEMRAAAADDYERQREELVAAGVDLTPPTDDEIVKDLSERLAASGDVSTNSNHIIHRAMTGEGLRFRHPVDGPEDDETVHAMLVIVRPVHATGASDRARRALAKAWPGLDITMSDTGCPNAPIQAWKGSFRDLASRSEAVSGDPSVEEVTILLATGRAGLALTTGDNGRIVERICALKATI